MNRNDLPPRWKTKIQDYLKEKGSPYKTLSASDFIADKTIEIEFKDGSFARFHYPLVIEAPEFGEVGVMTEHCGYFIFNKEAMVYRIK